MSPSFIAIPNVLLLISSSTLLMLTGGIAQNVNIAYKNLAINITKVWNILCALMSACDKWLEVSPVVSIVHFTVKIFVVSIVHFTVKIFALGLTFRILINLTIGQHFFNEKRLEAFLPKSKYLDESLIGLGDSI